MSGKCRHKKGLVIESVLLNVSTHFWDCSVAEHNLYTVCSSCATQWDLFRTFIGNTSSFIMGQNWQPELVAEGTYKASEIIHDDKWNCLAIKRQGNGEGGGGGGAK